MTSAPLTDTEITDQLRSGDRRLVNEATAKLLVQWRGIVVSQVLQYQGNPDKDVSPVLDEALAVFVRNVQEGIYKPEKSAPTTYFHRIVRNRLLNRLRQDITWRNHHHSMDGLPEHLPLKEKNAEKLMESEENRKKMTEAILKLDKPCQKVLFDFWWEGKSLKEIALETGKTQDATKQKHHRCLAQLRKLLGDDLKDWFNK